MQIALDIITISGHRRFPPWVVYLMFFIKSVCESIDFPVLDILQKMDDDFRGDDISQSFSFVLPLRMRPGAITTPEPLLRPGDSPTGRRYPASP